MQDDKICNHKKDNWLMLDITDKEALNKRIECAETQPINENPIAKPVFYNAPEFIQDLKKSYERCLKMANENKWDESQVGWYFFLAFDEFFKRYENYRDK